MLYEPGRGTSRASIVAIMAKVNRRAKVPEQNASWRPLSTGEKSIRRQWPWPVGRIRAHIRAGGANS